MTKRAPAASTRAGVGARVAVAVAVAFVVASASVVARADDAAAPSGSAASSSPSAQDHYTAGRESYRLGLYGRALEAFERSLALAPSPNTRLYIARSLRELGRWAEASEQYAATVREAEQRGGRYTATRDAATVELADVKLRLERANANDSVVASAPAASPSAPPPAASDTAAPHSEPSASTWIAGGIAVAGAASFGVLYGLAGGRFGYLEDNCARVRTSSCDDARTTGKTEEAVAYVALGVAVVAGAIAIYSLLRSPATSTAAAHASASPSPSPRELPWRLAF